MHSGDVDKKAGEKVENPLVVSLLVESTGKNNAQEIHEEITSKLSHKASGFFSPNRKIVFLFPDIYG